MKTFDIIIFAVKPQIANDVLNDYENFELKKYSNRQYHCK